MPATGDDRATLGNFLADLSFAEAHAMLYGFAHGAAMVLSFFLAGVLGLAMLRDTSIALLVVFLVLNGWAKMERTKNIPLVSTIINAIPKAIRGQIRDELHYYDYLFAAGAVLAFAAAWAVGLV